MKSHTLDLLIEGIIGLKDVAGVESLDDSLEAGLKILRLLLLDKCHSFRSDRRRLCMW